VLWYHSNEGKEIVGIAKVAKESYQDPTTEDTNWVVVDLKCFKKLKKPITLEQIKADKRLANMGLVRQGRLSVSSLTVAEFDTIIALSEEK
jgi:predicted RNA-binding protein with PUA-like domain